MKAHLGEEGNQLRRPHFFFFAVRGTFSLFLVLLEESGVTATLNFFCLVCKLPFFHDRDEQREARYEVNIPRQFFLDVFCCVLLMTGILMQAPYSTFFFVGLLGTTHFLSCQIAFFHFLVSFNSIIYTY